jgi:hypothetical protein
MMETLPTAAQFRNAIYLDFEGRKSINDENFPLPHMAGFFRPNEKGKNGKYNAIFFKPDWQPACNGVFRRAEILNFQESFNLLLEELVARDSYLIYWTIHEEKILERHLTPKTFKTLKPRMYNLHPVARKYANRFRKFGRGESARGKSLEEFFATLVRKRSPMPPIDPKPAEVCNRIDRACAAHARWKHFSPKQKNYVKDLIAYNEGDCRSTWLIAKRLGNFYSYNKGIS